MSLIGTQILSASLAPIVSTHMATTLETMAKTSHFACI